MIGQHRLNVAFLHPELGLGGAERLVVDAAIQLQAAGHRVTIFTSHHDHTRCFAETRDGTLDVRVHGAFLPAHIEQRLRVPCAIATETIRHEETGLLCPPTPAAFAQALTRLITDRQAAARMGRAGRTHVARNFSLRAFGQRLDSIVRETAAGSPRPH